MRPFDALIIGGGAAGLWCAITAGRRGRRVAVLDHAERLGRKILISGGGRCNFTNLHASPANYLSANPHFCTSALARFRPEDFVREIELAGIAYHEKKLGQLFCDGRATQIVALLLDACAAAGVELVTSCRIEQVARVEAFVVQTSLGAFTAPRLVVATGGLSLPPTGASDLGYRLARQFGCAMVETAPALVPLTLPEADGLAGLSGLSTDCTVSAGGTAFREHLLVTHRGLSGPAILQASSYWHAGAALEIDLLPDQDAHELFTTARAAGSATLGSVLATRLPKRLAQWWLAGHGGDRPLQGLGAPALVALAEQLHRWRVVPAGSEGYRTAEVTRGGVDTHGLSSQTMEARAQPGLHFIGEVVDVTGWLGGYNFQWAWASGHAAGNAL